jgi:RNA methyltransferase, TrmH family
MAGAVARQHSSVKRYRELARTPPLRSLDRELLLDGVHLLIEAHASRIPIETAAFDQAALKQPAVRALAENLAAAGTEVLIVSGNVLEAMSPVKTPSGAVGIARRSMVRPAEALRGKTALVVLACDVQDPGNVGALMRAAEAAGATAFVACGATADPLGWKALRGSMGSALRLPIARADIDEALRECRGAAIQTVALAARGGDAFFKADFRGPTALLLGSEGAGLPIDIAARVDRLLSIPMQEPVESLNVAVAAALVLYEAFRQRTP